MSEGGQAQERAETNHQRALPPAALGRYGLLDGDFVSIIDPSPTVYGPGTWAAGAMLAFVILDAYLPRGAPGRFIPLCLSVVLIMAAAWAHSLWRKARVRRAAVVAAMGSGPDSAATLCLLARPRHWRDGGPRFDTTSWLASQGQGAARVVLAGVLPLPVPAPEDLFEEVDVANRRALSAEERRYVLVGVALAVVGLVAMVTIAAQNASGAAGWRAYVPYVLMVGAAAHMALMYGRLPFALSAAVVSPGRVECGGWGGTGAFTRADSVLVLSAATGWTMATLVRADGRRRVFSFMGTMENPGLQQLLARWCCRPGAGLPPT